MDNFASIFTSSEILTKGYTGEINSIDAYEDSSLEDSFFIQTLKFVKESREEFNTANKKFYRSVLESGDDYIAITEAFDGFFDSIKSIINKVIEFIKTLWGKFLTQLNKFFNSEKYLKDHLKDLDKFTSENEFTFDGFEFTISDAVPAKEVISNLIGVGSGADLDATDNLTTNADLEKKYNALISKLEDDWYDKARAQILGRPNGAIVDSDYAEELFKEFRNGESHKQELTVGVSSLSTYKIVFEKHKDLEKEAKKTKNRLENEYNDIKKGFDNAVKRTGDNYSFIYKTAKGEEPIFGNDAKLTDSDARKTLELYVKAKSDQISRLSNLHLLAFSAKLDAIKDQTRQAKFVLYKSLYRIQGKLNSKEV